MPIATPTPIQSLRLCVSARDHFFVPFVNFVVKKRNFLPLRWQRPQRRRRDKEGLDTDPDSDPDKALRHRTSGSLTKVRRRSVLVFGKRGKYGAI
jgi:hypothetical protein